MYRQSSLAVNAMDMAYYNLSTDLALFKGKESYAASIGPNYIRVASLYNEVIRLRRYYKDDWDGIFIDTNGFGVESQVFDCKPTTVKISPLLDALKKDALALGLTVE